MKEYPLYTGLHQHLRVAGEKESQQSRAREEKAKKKLNKRKKVYKTRLNGWKDGQPWEVEQILNHKVERGQLSYFVKWKGWSINAGSWVKERDVMAPDLVATYLSKIIKKK